ncbi:asparaginase domain-containing protein [Pseudomonas sp. F1_0610]|uniref:asparaginase domain-containing protein n=1 Tax=Pseudomonas sp. F1_0610 TaxID=3114284 RepID=UPI0039C28429
MSIQIFTTGGTFDKIYFDALSEFSIGEPCAPDILQQAQVSFSYQVSSLLKKDSLEITDDDRQLIVDAVQACSADKILITHGTDTMPITAEALLGISSKTVVLVGAMQPARMRETDAPFNLGFALGALQCLSKGIYIAMNGNLFEAGKVIKNRAAGRFESKTNV